MAEGAKFFLISPDFEVKRLEEFSPERLDKVGEMLEMLGGKIINFLFQIFSFSFYSLLDSSSKKYKDLARRLNLCYFRKQKKTHQIIYATNWGRFLFESLPKPIMYPKCIHKLSSQGIESRRQPLNCQTTKFITINSNNFLTFNNIPKKSKTSPREYFTLFLLIMEKCPL